MTSTLSTGGPPRLRQRGSFLLEALVAILIVALGVLGLVGLQARAMQDTDETRSRGEAAFLASDIVGRMWASNPVTLQAGFQTNATVGSPYDDFKQLVNQRLPGASAITPPNPDVVVTPRAAGGFDVTVTIRWRPPSSAFAHRYDSFAVVGLN